MAWLDADVIEPALAIADPEARLRDMLVRHAKLTAGNEAWITVLLDEMHALPPALRRRIEQRKRRYEDLVRDMLRQLQRAGRLRGAIPRWPPSACSA